MEETRDDILFRWGDIYANTPTKKMIALYDYDPMELSPNVDMEVQTAWGIIFYFLSLGGIVLQDRGHHHRLW